MSDDTLITLGFAAIVGLALIPVVMIGRLVLAFILDHRATRRAEARRVTRTVPGLGELSTTDDNLWVGNVSGVQVRLWHAGGPPTSVQAAQLRVILDDLPQFVEKSRAYLASHEDCSWLDGGAARFQPETIEPETSASFFLELFHPTDLDGVYRVEFRDGEPVDSVRDD